jgi:DNA-binding IclR family transcriptional regulator
MTADRYINAAQQRVLKILLMLAGHEVNGLLPSELAKAMRTSNSNITRDLANLKEAGIAEQREETGGWALTTRVAQISVKVLTAMNKAKEHLDEMQKRYETRR